MSAKSDFEKFLASIIGAVPAERNTKHACWRIGKELLRVPTDLSGMRTFRNYRAEALRMARRQGLLPEEVRRALVTERPRRKPKQSRPLPAPIEEATPEEVAAWKEFERLRWQRQQEGMGMDEPKRTIIRDEDRIPLTERVLREAANPLTSWEVCRPLGWEGEHHRRAVLRILRAYPQRFRPTRGQKKNERYTLTVPAEQTPTPDVETAAKPPKSTAVEPSEANTKRLMDLFRKIKGTLDGFGTKSSPQDAVLIIGEIRGLIKALTPEEPGTPPATQP